MADEKLNIHIATTADSKGVAATQKSFDQLDQDLDKIVSNMERFGAEFEDAISNGDAELAQEKFAQLRIEAEKLKDTMVDLGVDGVEGLEAMTEQLEKAEDQIKEVSKEAKKGDDAIEKLVDLEKINQLGEITNSVINVGRGFGDLTDMVRESDGSMGDHIKTGQHMAQVGTEMGLSIVRATAAFGPWGGAVAAASLAIQAGVTLYQEYQRAQTAGAEAAKKFADAAREAADEAAAQADASAAAAKAATDYETALTKRTALEKAWGDQLARSNGLLDEQEEKLNQQAEGAKKLLQAKAELAKTTIDSDKSLSDEQKDALKRGVDEKLTQTEFVIDQKRSQRSLISNRSKQENLTNYINGKISEVNALQRTANNTLTSKEREAIEDQKNAIEQEYYRAAIAGDSQGAQKIIESDRYQDTKKTLQNDKDLLGSDYKSKEDVEAKIREYLADIEAKRTERSALRNAAERTGFDLNLGRDIESVRRETANIRERETRKKESLQNKENEFVGSSEQVAAQFAGAAKAGLKAGRKADAELLQKIANELDDGASAQEIKRAADTLAMIQSKTNSDVLGILKSAVQKLNKKERELSLLKRQQNHNR